MLKVCIPYTNYAREQNDFDYLLSNFQVDEIFVICPNGEPLPDASNVVGQGTRIEYMYDLPQDYTHVLLTPQNGYEYKGNESLVSFVHPAGDVVYIVGSNHVHTTSDLEFGKDPDHLVYIPTDTADNMFNYVALAICLYDRKVKNG